jgi:acyl-CoA thioester hydrolase
MTDDDGHGVDLADAEGYAFWNDHTLRFADLDPAAHVNNVAIAALFESGRVDFWRTIGVAADDPGVNTVVARVVIDYRAQLHFPGDVRVGSRILRIGRSSCLIGQGLFAGGRCAATSEAVSVLVDRSTDRSTAIPDALRARLLAWAKGG